MAVTLHRVLIDTCIWLDLARSYRAAPLVRALYEMCDNAQLEIIVPDIVREEFARNKERVLAESSKSLQSTLKTMKSALPSFVDLETQKEVLGAIQGLDFKSTTGGTASIVEQVEELLDHPENIQVECTVFQKARAANRALDRQAPCHRDKNSMADAVLFEVYDELRAEPVRDHVGFAFATTNYKDFSEYNGDNRLPHSDLKYAFNEKSLFVVDIAKFVEDNAPGFQDIFDLEQGISPAFRSLTDLIEAEHLLLRQVWYNRHMNLRFHIDQGTHKVVAESEYSRSPYRSDQTLDTVWEKALAAAKAAEEEVGNENLGPWDDFEWGMINGKLSAIRWVLGDEWDMLDT